MKIGGYGLFKFVIVMCSVGVVALRPFLVSICLISLVYTSLMALRQLYLKRIVAYSSIAHMNSAVLGFLSLNSYGILGGLMLMLAHGIISTMFFFLNWCSIRSLSH